MQVLFERFVLNEHSKNGRFVSDLAKIWICGLYVDVVVIIMNRIKIVCLMLCGNVVVYSAGWDASCL